MGRVRYGYAIALALIVLVGAALRTYDLSSVPTELIVDEIDLYNSAHSIVLTGHDLDGSQLPFLYSSFTRNPPMYAIAGYASTMVLGKNAFGWRFPAALFGVTAIVFLFGIVLEATGRRDVALFAAALLATQPIFIQFSRVGWEPASELPFLLAGLYVLLRGLNRSMTFKDGALAALLLALTCYTYMAGWFYSVVLGGGAIALNLRRFFQPLALLKLAGACVIWLLVAAPALWMLFFDPLTGGKIGRIATFGHGLTPETLRVFASNYAAHFRWAYLVTSGDPIAGVTWRYLNGFGALYWWVVPLAIIGAVCALSYVRARWIAVWLYLWLLAYPLGGALTNDGAPNAPRTLAGAPVMCILGAIGLAVLIDRAARLRPAVYVAAALALASSLALFVTFYFTRYVHMNSNAWDSGTRAMFAAVRAQAPRYERVCFSVRPAWYGIDAYTRFYLDGVPIRTIDNVEDPDCFLPSTLLVTDNDHPVSRSGFKKLTMIDDVDGSPFAMIQARAAREHDKIAAPPKV